MLAATLLLLLLFGSAPSGTPIGTPTAEARCGERLAAKYNVVSRYPKLYALQYKKSLKVSVTTHHGPLVDWQVQLYTFQGQLLGQSKRKSTLNSTKTARVKLKFPIQAGKFTLVVKGTPRGCGPESETADVIRFSECTTRLPLKFPDKPGGVASDYGGFLSVPVESRNGALIKDPESEVYSFGGEFFGRSVDNYKVVFGRVTFNNKLVKPLRAGGYTVVVDGRIDQPRSCGNKTTQTELTFG